MARKQHGAITPANRTPSDPVGRGIHPFPGFSPVATHTVREAIDQIEEDRGRAIDQTGGTMPGFWVADGADDWFYLGGFTINVLSHGSRHEAGEDDEIDVTDLSGLLADAQTPLAHAAAHVDSDPIQSATAEQDGLATAEQIAALESLVENAALKTTWETVLTGAGPHTLTANTATPYDGTGVDMVILTPEDPADGDEFLLKEVGSSNNDVLLQSFDGVTKIGTGWSSGGTKAVLSTRDLGRRYKYRAVDDTWHLLSSSIDQDKVISTRYGSVYGDGYLYPAELVPPWVLSEGLSLDITMDLGLEDFVIAGEKMIIALVLVDTGSESLEDKDMEKEGVSDWSEGGNVALSKDTTKKYAGAQSIKVTREDDGEFADAYQTVPGGIVHVKATAAGDGSGGAPCVKQYVIGDLFEGTDSVDWQSYDGYAFQVGSINSVYFGCIAGDTGNFVNFDEASVISSKCYALWLDPVTCTLKLSVYGETAPPEATLLAESDVLSWSYLSTVTIGVRRYVEGGDGRFEITTSGFSGGDGLYQSFVGGCLFDWSGAALIIGDGIDDDERYL
jgi:hypothetical protein